jgi:hypothetical protein
MIEIISGLILVVCLGGCAWIAIEQRRMLRQIRKLAALYPPFLTDDDDGKKITATSVHSETMWDEDTVPRD